jgi:hypothetical protein
MDLKVAGNQLILSGPVVGDEFGKVEKILDDDRTIDTVILRNSPGGDPPTGYRIGELFRVRGLRTAVSGYCYSSCSRMFLGGATRHFTDDFPPEYTDVGFHGTTTGKDTCSASTSRPSGSRIGSSNIQTARPIQPWLTVGSIFRWA